MKILLTELGNTASGDPELWAETCRRLSPAHEITLLHRLPDPSCLAVHGMGAFPSHELFMPVLPDDCAKPEDLDKALAAADPDAHAALHMLVAAHDGVAIAPGGKFLDGYNYQNALAAVSAARLQGKPYWVLHQSIGPLRPSPRRELLSALLRNAELVLLRDRLSHRFVRSLAGDLPSVRLTADPLLALPARPVEPPAYDIGLNFRLSFNGWVSPGDLLGFVAKLLESHPQRILIYTTTHELGPDLVAAAERLGADCRPSVLAPPDLLAVPGSCRVNVTDSFHGTIFSLRAGRPAVMCQADYNSWKLQGTFRTGWRGSPVHPGPNSPARTRSLLRLTRRALRNPERWHQRQSRELPRLLDLVESGWSAALQSLT